METLQKEEHRPTHRPVQLLTLRDRAGWDVPSEVTSFVGREGELARLSDLQAETRLLTLVGPGGVGKTRLALRLAADLRRRLSGRHLAGGPEPSRRPGACAAGGGRRARGAAAARPLVVGGADKSAALAADPADARQLRAPGRGLRRTGRWFAAGLSRPASAGDQPAAAGRDRRDRLARAAAVGASWTRPATAGAGRQRGGTPVRGAPPMPTCSDFALDERNAPVVAEICRRLDGLPLALELVAARVESLGLAEVAARLQDRFALARGASQTAPRSPADPARDAGVEPQSARRGRTVLLRRWRCSSAAGRWKRPRRCAATTCTGRRRRWRIVLGQLVTKSLVVAERDGLTVRFRLLETVHAYALGELIAADERAALQRRHAGIHARSSLNGSRPSRVTQRMAALLRPEEDNRAGGTGVGGARRTGGAGLADGDCGLRPCGGSPATMRKAQPGSTGSWHSRSRQLLLADPSRCLQRRNCG